MDSLLNFTEVAPGIFNCPAFLSADECKTCLSTITGQAIWEKAALGKYVDNEVATSFVDLELRDVEVANGERIPLLAIRSKEPQIAEFIEKRGFQLSRFSRFMISKYAPGCHIRPHRDTSTYNTIRMFTIVCYLDNEYTGGELFFPKLGLSHRPKAGELIFFFSEHEHGVSPVLSGIRHCVVWFAENKAIRGRI